MGYSTVTMVRMALVSGGGAEVPSPVSNTAADLSNTQLTDHIAEADALIDGYLAKWYTVPVAAAGDPAVVPSPINYWSRNIAVYTATCTYRGSLDFTDSDPVARRYKATMDALKDLAAGRISLGLPGVAGGATGGGSAGSPLNPYEGDMFGPDDWTQESGLGNNGYPYSESFWGSR